jgi:hypothetical protein
MNGPTSDPHTKALEFFKDWTNYLLVTTVAALGWVATSQSLDFSSDRARALCILSFAASVMFGIFTLAVIPIIQEERQGSQSIYEIAAPHSLFGRRQCRLVSVCYPQHILFLLGIVTFALSTAFNPTRGGARTLDYVLLAVTAIVVIGIWVVWRRSGPPWQAVKVAGTSDESGSPVASPQGKKTEAARS